MKLDLSSRNLVHLADKDLHDHSPSHTTILSLSSNLLSSLPTNLLYFIHLRKLNLDNNNLQKLNLRHLPLTLRWLSLKNNQIRGIHFSFTEEEQMLKRHNVMKTFANLEFLDLSQNSLESLPKGFHQLFPHLRTCFLADNFIACLPEEWPANLVHLDLSENSITSFDECRSLKKLKRLKFLRMKGNPIQNLPSYQFICGNIVNGLRLLDDNVVSNQAQVSEEDAYVEPFADDMDSLEDEFDNHLDDGSGTQLGGGISQFGTVLSFGPSTSMGPKTASSFMTSSMRGSALINNMSHFQPHTGIQPLSPPESRPSSPPGTPIVDLDSDSASITNMTPTTPSNAHRVIDMDDSLSMQPKEIEPDAEDPHIDYELILRDQEKKMQQLRITLPLEDNDGSIRGVYSPVRPSPLTVGSKSHFGGVDDSRSIQSSPSRSSTAIASPNSRQNGSTRLFAKTTVQHTRRASPVPSRKRRSTPKHANDVMTASVPKTPPKTPVTHSSPTQHQSSPLNTLIEENTNLKMEIAYIRELLATQTKEKENNKRKMKEMQRELAQLRQVDMAAAESHSSTISNLQERHNALLTKYSELVQTLEAERKKTKQLRDEKAIADDRANFAVESLSSKTAEYEKAMQLFAQYMKDQDEDLMQIMRLKSNAENSSLNGSKQSTRQTTAKKSKKTPSKSSKTSNSSHRSFNTSRRDYSPSSKRHIPDEIDQTVSVILAEADRLKTEFPYHLISKCKAQKLAGKRLKESYTTNLSQHKNIPCFDDYSHLKQEKRETGKFANSTANFANQLRSPPPTIAQERARRARQRQSWRQSCIQDHDEEFEYQKLVNRSLGEEDEEQGTEPTSAAEVQSEDTFTQYYEQQLEAAEVPQANEQQSNTKVSAESTE